MRMSEAAPVRSTHRWRSSGIVPSASTLVHAVSAIESAVSPSARYTIAFDIVPPGE